MTALRALVGELLRRPATRYTTLLVALGYALLYLWLTGDLAGGGQGGVAADFPAWARLFERRGAWQFEPVGRLVMGPLVWTFSPLNLALALGLGLLLGLNLAAAWQGWRTPRACRFRGARTGALAALPALLAGGGCCAPLLLIWLGLPIVGALATLAPWLVPLGALLLVAGLWAQARAIAGA